MKQTQRLAFSAMMIAIILLMAMVPFLGYITIGVVAITIIHIPVLVGAMTFKDRNIALIAGLTFGISSWMVALFRPTVVTDVVFQNPLVSVLPRILFALIAYYLYKRLSESMKNKALAIAISAGVSTFFHTVMVLGMLYIFGRSMFPDGFMILLLTTLQVNGWIEIALATVIVPPIVMVLNRTIKIS